MPLLQMPHMSFRKTFWKRRKILGTVTLDFGTIIPDKSCQTKANSLVVKEYRTQVNLSSEMNFWVSEKGFDVKCAWFQSPYSSHITRVWSHYVCGCVCVLGVVVSITPRGEAVICTWLRRHIREGVRQLLCVWACVIARRCCTFLESGSFKGAAV